MHKLLFPLIVLIFSCSSLLAQNSIDSAAASIQLLASSLQESPNLSERINTNNIIQQKLLLTLQNPLTFNYNFDSLTAIKRISAPDGLFNLFTWQVEIADGQFMQNGIMQIKITEDSVKLISFKDESVKMENPDNENCSIHNWLGAIYYDIHATDFNGTKYYTLLGYDEYSNTMTQKIIEVLHFENNEPILGGDYFIYPPDETYPSGPVQRFIYTYKKGSNAYVKFEKNYNAIILSELSSIDNNLKNKSTLVPSGDEVYFVWKNGKWVMPKK